MGVGIESFRELMAKMDALPESSKAVVAGKAFVEAIFADVRARGAVGTALLAALNAARDPADPLYKDMSVIERVMATSMLNSLVKSLEA